GRGTVGNLRLAGQQSKHNLDVDDRLFDFAVDHAHEIQRSVELNHHGVDHDKVTNRVGALFDAYRAQYHRGRQPNGENHRLSGVEHREGHIGLDTCVLVARHRAIIPLRLARLGGKVFHGLVIQQRVDRLGVGVAVAVVHPPTNVDTPLGRIVGKQHVKNDRGGDHSDVAPIEMEKQNRDNQSKLDNSRSQLQQHHTHDRLDGVAATLEDPGQTAGLALKVKAQRQKVQVLEGEHR